MWGIRTSRAFRRAGKLVVAATVAGAAAFGLSTTVGGPAGPDIALAEADPGVMAAKLQEAINRLQAPNRSVDDYEQAIDEAMEAIFTGNLVVLPTGDDPEAQDAHSLMQQQMQQAIQALQQHVQNNQPAAAQAAEARNFLLVTQEALEAIGETTSQPGCNPQQPQSCGPLQSLNEMPQLVDPSLPDGAFQRLVSAPHSLLGADGFADPAEETLTPGVITKNQCAVVVKELRGVAAVVRPAAVSIWKNPWKKNAAVIGSQVVWVYEFVPAEHIKTINTCLNNKSEQTQTITQKVVLDRGALLLWRGLPHTTD